MMLIDETAIADEVLPIEAFKAHLRLGSGFATGELQEPVLASFLRAAIAAVEGRTGKVLLARVFTLTVNAWQAGDWQALPVAPVSDVTQVEQVTADGGRTDIDLAGVWLERDSQRPKLRASGAALPAVPSKGSMAVHFEAGFAPDWAGVPADLRQAVLMLAAHYYEYRQDTGLSKGCMPFGVSSLIERYKNIRLGAGAVR